MKTETPTAPGAEGAGPKTPIDPGSPGSKENPIKIDDDGRFCGQGGCKVRFWRAIGDGSPTSKLWVVRMGERETMITIQQGAPGRLPPPPPTSTTFLPNSSSSAIAARAEIVEIEDDEENLAARRMRAPAAPPLQKG